MDNLQILNDRWRRSIEMVDVKININIYLNIVNFIKISLFGINRS